MEIQYSKDSLKYLSKKDKQTINRIKAAIEGLTRNPPIGDIKIMKGYDDGRKRLRVGKYRIVYKYIDDNKIAILFIIDINTRGDIYK